MRNATQSGIPAIRAPRHVAVGSDTIKCVKLACGKHWANPDKKKEGDPCTKCKMHADERARGVLQHNGTPWIALLGDPVPKPSWWS